MFLTVLFAACVRAQSTALVNCGGNLEGSCSACNGRENERCTTDNVEGICYQTKCAKSCQSFINVVKNRLMRGKHKLVPDLRTEIDLSKKTTMLENFACAFPIPSVGFRCCKSDGTDVNCAAFCTNDSRKVHENCWPDRTDRSRKMSSCRNEDSSDYATAVETCESLGMRLCLASEFKANKCKNTGCNYDSKRIWVGQETCSGPLCQDCVCGKNRAACTGEEFCKIGSDADGSCVTGGVHFGNDCDINSICVGTTDAKCTKNATPASDCASSDTTANCKCRRPDAATGSTCGSTATTFCKSSDKCVVTDTDADCSGAVPCTCKTPDARAGSACGNDAANKSCAPGLECVDSNTDEVCSGARCKCKTRDAVKGGACGETSTDNACVGGGGLVCVNDKTDLDCDGTGCKCKTRDLAASAVCGTVNSAQACGNNDDLACVDDKTDLACTGEGCKCKKPDISLGTACGSDGDANKICLPGDKCVTSNTDADCSGGGCKCKTPNAAAGESCGVDDTSAQTNKSCAPDLECVNSKTDEVCSGAGCTCNTPNAAAAGAPCGVDDTTATTHKSCETALKCVNSVTDEVCSGAGCTCKTPDALVGSACGNDDAANKSCAPDLECVNSNTYEVCSGTGCACKTHFIDSTSPIIGEDSSACQGNPNAACTTKDDKLGKCDSTGMQCQPIDCNDSNVCELVLTDKTRTYIWYIIPIAIIIGAGCVWFIIICLVRRRNHNKFRFETQMDCERDLDAVILSEHQIQNTSPSAQPTPDTYCITEAVDLLPERLHGDRTGSLERLGPRDSNTGDEVRRSVTIWRPDELAQNTESVACGANLRPIELRERDTDARTRSMTLLASENTPERDHTKDGNRSLRVTEVPRPSGTCQMSEEPRPTEASHPSEVLRSSGVSLPSEVLRSSEVSHPTEVSHSSSTSLRRDTSRLSRARVRSRKSGSRIAKDAPNSRIPLE